jgi:hypothetical protein
MYSITANELKTKGTAILNQRLASTPEIGISVHGHVRYIVMPVEQYQHYREAALAAALVEAQEDIAANRYTTSIEEHMKQVAA